MQSTQQLSALAAAESSGLCTMERSGCTERERIEGKECVSKESESLGDKSELGLPLSSASLSSSNSTKKRAPPPVLGPWLHPLPTIETIMAYPSLSRPTYDALVRGEPPAQKYNTVIHTPKPANLRPRPDHAPDMSLLDQILMRTADLQADGRSGKRTRSNTNSSYSSSAPAYSAQSRVSGSTYEEEKEGIARSLLVPPSPAASISSSSRATIASSPPTSPPPSPFPLASHSPSPSPPLPGDASGASSPAQSFHSPSASIYESYSSENTSPNSSTTSTSSRSTVPSPASSAYPSPPATPLLSRTSSSSEEFMAYPSPPVSPLNAPDRRFTNDNTQMEAAHRELKPSFASRNPPPAEIAPATVAPTQIVASPLPDFPMLPDTILDDEDEEEDDDDDDEMDWSMNGGEVVIGAAGLAVSPRAMGSRCCHCECRGLGLYVIDEEEEMRAYGMEIS